MDDKFMENSCYCSRSHVPAPVQNSRISSYLYRRTHIIFHRPSQELLGNFSERVMAVRKTRATSH